MPQLDYGTYISQVLWLLIIFGTLYYISKKYILPTLSGILKYRYKKIDYLNRTTSSLKDEELASTTSHDLLIQEVVLSTRLILNELTSSGIIWIDQTTNELNNHGLAKLNSEYLNSMVLIGAKKYIINQYL